MNMQSGISDTEEKKEKAERKARHEVEGVLIQSSGFSQVSVRHTVEHLGYAL